MSRFSGTTFESDLRGLRREGPGCTGFLLRDIYD